MYWASNNIGMIHSRRMGWVGHVARTGKNINTYRIWLGARRKESTRKTYAYMER